MRGRGLGSIFSGLFRSLRPLASMGLQAGKRFLQSDMGKNLTSTAMDVGKEAVKNLALDILEGKSVKESAGEELKKAKSRIAQTLRGRGKKRKKLSNEKSIEKRVKYSLLD